MDYRSTSIVKKEMVKVMYIVLTLILLAMTVILALTLPHLKIFQPKIEHVEVLFALIYAPAFTSIVICVIVLFIKMVNGE